MPFYRFQLSSRLSAAMAAERLRTMVGPPPTFAQAFQRAFGSDSRQYPPFVGSVDGRHFNVRRDIRYRNSFLPRVSGQIVPAAGGSTVQVTMYMHPLIGVFMAIWFSGVIMAIVNSARVSSANGAWYLVPVAMFFFGVALCLGGFIPEAIKAKRLLMSGIAKGDGAG